MMARPLEQSFGVADLEAPDAKFLATESTDSPSKGSLGGRSSWLCCCRRRRGVAAFAPGPLAELAAVRARAFPSSSAREVNFRNPWQDTPPEATPEPGSRGGEDCYTLLGTPRAEKASQQPAAFPSPPQPAPANVGDAGGDDDFYDACSEAGSDGETSPPRAGMGDAADSRSADVQEKLGRLLGIERRCRNLDGGAKVGPAADLEVESVLSEEHAQLWFCHSEECPFVIGCMRCTLQGVRVEDAVQAIQSPEQRMNWDHESFKSFELVKPHDPSDPTREDAIYTVMPAPRPVRDREILQSRWQVALPGGGGGQALIMRSFEDDDLRAPHPQRVRAFTHLSGYILRPLGCETGEVGASRPPPLEVVVVSQCDIGGALPAWFQNLARRLAKRKAVDWGKKLGDHCLRSARQGP